MKVKVKKDFSWAHRGIDVVEYKAGETIEIDDPDLIKVAGDEGWIEKQKGSGAKQGDKPASQGDNPSPDGDSGGDGGENQND